MLRTFLTLSFTTRKSFFISSSLARKLQTSQKIYSEDKKTEKALVPRDPFQEIKNKNRNTYIEMVKIYVDNNSIYRTGHVEFIYSALKNMEMFGVNRDLEVYKALIDCLPKGKCTLNVYKTF